MCMAFISINSSKSGVQSHKQSGVIEEVVEKVVPDKVQTSLKDSKFFKSIDYTVRKSAHMIEFFILAIAVSALLFTLGIRGKSAVIYILFVVLMYAVLDEFHQLYVPGRTSTVKDVLIDFSGGTVGTIVFYWIYYKFITKRVAVNSKVKMKDYSDDKVELP
ncbi:MAG: VanZ family protein [Clostridium sp.]